MKKKTLSKVKKDTWNIFSKFIRTRDCLETTGCSSWGFCITCKEPKRLHFKVLQAGHFIAGRNNAVLFSEKGVHAQCYNCNINLKGNTLVYRRKIIEMYGEGYDEVLEKESWTTVKYTIPDLLEMQDYYKAKILELEG